MQRVIPAATNIRKRSAYPYIFTKVISPANLGSPVLSYDASGLQERAAPMLVFESDAVLERIT
jgi:hypothetical protein